MSIRRFESYPRLSSALTVTFLLCGLLLVFLLLAKISGHVAQFEDRAQSEIVEKGSDGIALALNKSIESTWKDLTLVAEGIDPHDEDEVARFLAALVLKRAEVSWAGFVDIEGQLLNATDSRADRVSMQEASWFFEALVDGVASEFDPGVDGASKGTLTLARSVNVRGSASGVIFLSFDVDYIADQVVEATSGLGVQAAVVDNVGNIIMLPRDFGDPTRIQERIRAIFVSQLRMGVAPKILHDDERILSIRPQFLSSSLPHLGWHLVTWSSNAPSAYSAARFAEEVSTWIFVAIAIATIVPMVLVIHFVRPLERLANTARKMADGVFEFPEERCFTREAAMLSAALVRLQTQLAQGDAKGSEFGAEEAEGDVDGSVVLHLRQMSPHRLMKRLSRFA